MSIGPAAAASRGEGRAKPPRGQSSSPSSLHVALASEASSCQPIVVRPSLDGRFCRPGIKSHSRVISRSPANRRTLRTLAEDRLGSQAQGRGHDDLQGQPSLGQHGAPEAYKPTGRFTFRLPPNATARSCSYSLR